VFAQATGNDWQITKMHFVTNWLASFKLSLLLKNYLQGTQTLQQN